MLYNLFIAMLALQFPLTAQKVSAQECETNEENTGLHNGMLDGLKFVPEEKFIDFAQVQHTTATQLADASILPQIARNYIPITQLTSSGYIDIPSATDYKPWGISLRINPEAKNCVEDVKRRSVPNLEYKRNSEQVYCGVQINGDYVASSDNIEDICTIRFNVVCADRDTCTVSIPKPFEREAFIKNFETGLEMKTKIKSCPITFTEKDGRLKFHPPKTNHASR